MTSALVALTTWEDADEARWFLVRSPGGAASDG
jgi:hypothetical protein